jgi:rRNA maturation protein Rpf1
MFVTTSRDPSAKARRFARALASFLSLPYVNRGKQRPGEDETWLVVVEDHGNPAGLVKHSSEKTEQLSFQLSGDTQARRLKRCAPKVAGEGVIALPLAQFFELEWLGEAATDQGRIIKVASGIIDFMDEGQAKFRLKV